jgi:hypothetical protein
MFYVKPRFQRIITLPTLLVVELLCGLQNKI